MLHFTIYYGLDFFMTSCSVGETVIPKPDLFVCNENLKTWTGTLSGGVTGIDPQRYYVAIFVKKDKLWENLEHESNAKISLSEECRWICTPACSDLDHVSEVIVFLIPNRFNTPIVDGEMSLPVELYLVSVATHRIKYSAED